MSEKIDVITVLIDHEADVMATNRDDWTPLHYAAQTGNKNVYNLLKEQGASEAAENSSGEKPTDVTAKDISKRYKR